MKKALTIIAVVVLAWGCGKNTPQAGKSTVQSLPPAARQDTQWIQGWRETSALQGQRAGTAAVAHNGFVYVIGGVDGRDFVATVEYAPIHPDGSLGQWRIGPALNVERGFIDAVVHNDSIYVVGGGNGPPCRRWRRRSRNPRHAGRIA